jgi:hypothetical protein
VLHILPILEVERDVLDRVPVLGPGLLSRGSHASGLSGKLLVPVRSVGPVLASFRHVVAVSSSDPNGGVPLLKLRILDNLIESYLKARRDTSVAPGGEPIEVSVTRRTVDTTISALAADLHETLAAQGSTPLGGSLAEAGGVLSLGA